jgi:hypothetical protein
MKQILTDINGSLSSKRVVMFVLLFMFIAHCITNLVTGKALSPTIADQLYYMLMWVSGTVFGEQVTNLFKK